MKEPRQGEGDFVFEERQRDGVCRGMLCPHCLSANVRAVGHTFDGVSMNAQYDCLECGGMWEGH